MIICFLVPPKLSVDAVTMVETIISLIADGEASVKVSREASFGQVLAHYAVEAGEPTYKL